MSQTELGIDDVQLVVHKTSEIVEEYCVWYDLNELMEAIN